MLNIKTFMCNLLQENTYVVSDDTKECVIIDCGAYYEEERTAITQYIDNEGLKPVHLLCTHGHFDHNFGIDTIYHAYGLKAEIAEEDGFLINDIPGQFLRMIGVPLKREYPPVGRYFEPNEVIRFGHHELKILKTPGHTPGGVVFYCEAEGIAFSGDTLFRMSVGRTDFEGGSYKELAESLKNVIAKMPAETTVYSGHGPKTTISDELKYNPYLH
ncbi:Glyoxylase, beta-lactamase superfamily II [Xylanibacter ruminicola]|jgi:glyoxylase-like metal-dependent hydrolase (beta-lactamase superfamily II)|uniref:Glyoxylase, beta-lactamase superfamily II n=1 Tax=Xylanibacter ruminicola TaxID=839 RepID=A0A1H5WKX2_XYLRU|nr:MULTISPECIES: MBL fold metallo-hydrolase [Prevotellaceae]MCR5470785.1 MBL fold metallo-hydrolase [Prevotella sp.]SEG00104.1 Glyoxylase, beta-lactamase superfamily II [Xylanibacter ruminicola]